MLFFVAENKLEYPKYHICDVFLAAMFQGKDGDKIGLMGPKGTQRYNTSQHN